MQEVVAHDHEAAVAEVVGAAVVEPGAVVEVQEEAEHLGGGVERREQGPALAVAERLRVGREPIDPRPVEHGASVAAHRREHLGALLVPHAHVEAAHELREERDVLGSRGRLRDAELAEDGAPEHRREAGAPDVQHVGLARRLAPRRAAQLDDAVDSDLV